MHAVVHRRWRSWWLADVDGRVNPLSQGGDTGSNPVGAASEVPVQRRVHRIACLVDSDLSIRLSITAHGNLAVTGIASRPLVGGDG
jgi:hypothetical protein